MTAKRGLGIQGIEKTELTVAFIPTVCSAPLIYAHAHGIFRKNGLQVDLIEAPEWSGIKHQTAQGFADAAHMLWPMPLACRLGIDGKNTDVRMLAAHHVNGQALTLARRHLGVTNVRDMKGFVFGVPYRFSMQYYLLCHYLAEHGVDPLRDVTIREVSPRGMPYYLYKGWVDGIFASEPFNQVAVHRGLGFLHVLSKDIWPGHPCCGLAARRELVEEFPNTYRQLLISLLQADLALHRATVVERQSFAREMSKREYLNQEDPVPVQQALSRDFPDGRGNHHTTAERVDFLPVPWEKSATWVVSQMRRWNQLSDRANGSVSLGYGAENEMRDLARRVGFEAIADPVVDGSAFDVGEDEHAFVSGQAFSAIDDRSAPLQRYSCCDAARGRLSEIAQQLAAVVGDFSDTRLEITARDEIGLLEQQINDTIRSLIFSRQALAEEKERLDESVSARTAELRREVAERKRAGAALLEREKQLRTIFESAVDGTILMDSTGKVTEANPAACRAHGYTQQELIGLDVSQLLHPDDQIRYRAFREGPRGHDHCECFHVRRDGSFFPAEEHRTTIEMGGQRHLLIVTRDISERREAEVQKTRHSLLIEGINHVFERTLVSEDEEEVAMVCLQVAERLTGSQFGWIGELNQAGGVDTLAISDPGRQANGLPTKEAAEAVKEIAFPSCWEGGIREGRTVIVNQPPPDADREGASVGAPTITSLIGGPLTQAGKSIGIIALANNPEGYGVSDQRMLESLSVAFIEALKRMRTEQARAASERKLRTITDAALDAVIMMDPEGRIAYWNPAAERMFGRSPEEALGQPMHHTLAASRFHGRAHVAVDTSVKTGCGGAVGKTIETEGLRKNGSEFPVEMALAPIELDGQWWAVATVRDITERKEAEAALRHFNSELIVAKMKLERRTVELVAQADELDLARAAAEAANRTKSAFLATISHELRTPMNSIIGFTGRLVEKLDGEISECDFDALQTVERNAHDLLALINRILLVSKFEAGEMALRRSRFDACSVVRGAVNQFSTLANRNGLPLKMQLPAHAIWIAADSTMTAQIVSNLVSNAIKYTTEGNVSVAVSESVDPEIGPALCIRVSDTGIGIRPEHRDRLFEMFTQLDEGTTRSACGTGLGLYIASKHVQMLGGRIEVTSQFGKGTAFTVLLPKTPDDASLGDHPLGDKRPSEITLGAVAAGRRGNLAPTEPVAGHGVGILCFDDDPGTLDSMRFAFTHAGFDVLLVEDYDTAVEQSWQQSPDIVFLDLGVSGRDAREVMTILQRGGALSQVPIVIMLLRREDAQDACSGMCFCLTNAADTDGLVNTVREDLPGDLSSVLVVDDDLDQRHCIARAFSEEGIQVRMAVSGKDGVERLAEVVPSAVILNLGMPQTDTCEFFDWLQRVPALRRIVVHLLVPPELEPVRVTELTRYTSVFMSSGETNSVALVHVLLSASSPRSSFLKEMPN